MILLSPSANQHALSCTPSTKDKILCATAVGSRRNLCVGFNSSHSGGHLLSGDRGEQLVVKATLSAISKLILGKRNYFFLCVIVPPVHDNQPMMGLGIGESPNSLSSSIVRGSTLIHKGTRELLVHSLKKRADAADMTVLYL